MDIVIEKEIINSKTNEKVGQAILYDHDKENDIICIDAYIIDGKYNGQLAERIIELLFESFENLDCNKVLTKVPEDEYLKNKLWGCLRFVYEYILREHIKIGSKYKNLTYISILKHEFNRFYLNENNIKRTIAVVCDECKDIWRCEN